jgi:hypothetical protein
MRPPGAKTYLPAVHGGLKVNAISRGLVSPLTAARLAKPKILSHLCNSVSSARQDRIREETEFNIPS